MYDIYLIAKKKAMIASEEVIGVQKSFQLF